MTIKHADHLEQEQRLDEVVIAYLEAVEAGQTPQPAQWLARYPELAAGLAEFFADQEQVYHWVGPLRQIAVPRSRTVSSSPDTVCETPSAAAATRIRSFGDYELLQEIGQGGMGVIYQARQKRLSRI